MVKAPGFSFVFDCQWGEGHMGAVHGGEAASCNPTPSSPALGLSSKLKALLLHTSSPVQSRTHCFLSTLLWTFMDSKNLGLTRSYKVGSISKLWGQCHTIQNHLLVLIACLWQEGPRKKERDFSSFTECELALGKPWWRQAIGLHLLSFWHSDPFGLTVESHFTKKWHEIWAQWTLKSNCSSTQLLREIQHISSLSHTQLNYLGVIKTSSMASWWIWRNDPCVCLVQHSAWHLGDSEYILFFSSL